MQPVRMFGSGLILAMGVATLGCADDESSSQQLAHQPSTDPLGVYEDQSGVSQRVDARAWRVDSDEFVFVNFDAVRDTAVAENGATNRVNAGKFSRFDWATDTEGQLRSCQSVLDAKTAAEAAAAPRADESDFVKGCGGATWSILQAPSILGTYSDAGQTDAITGETWTLSGEGYSSRFNLLVLSNSERYLIAENDAANAYFPGKFSRFDWTWDATKVLYYCQTKYDADTVADALAATPADSSDPATMGCSQFPWSRLLPSAP